jgi:uncharacterized protein (TIGR00725 family)
MKVKIGVMGSAEAVTDPALRETAIALGRAIANREAVLLTGATTGLIYEIGKAASDAGALHVGVSPASDEREHVERYQLPLDACSIIIYTGFGLKGRNVVLVRSCEIALFVAGSIGSLNEFTIAFDEGKIIGCLTGTGGVADEAEGLVQKLSGRKRTPIFHSSNAEDLLDICLNAFAATASILGE